MIDDGLKRNQYGFYSGLFFFQLYNGGTSRSSSCRATHP